MRTKFVSSRVWDKILIGMVLTFATTGCEAVPQWVERISKTVSETIPETIPKIDLPEINPGDDSSTKSSTPVQSPETAQIETQIQQRINQIRQQQGLSELQANEKLAAVARRYSQQMAEQNFFSHTSPAGETPAQRVRSAGIIYTLVGENLFKSTNISQPVSAAVEGWMDSPGHRENILRSQYRETGIGVWQDGETYYITQLFLRSFGF